MTEEKVRFQMRVSADTDRRIRAAMPLANCQSKNEFVEKALRFYCEFLKAEDCSEVLPPLLVSSLRATIQDTENRICRLLFKQAVELDMLMNVVASGMEIPEELLESLRGRCVRNVKNTRGAVTLESAVAFQSGAAPD